MSNHDREDSGDKKQVHGQKYFQTPPASRVSTTLVEPLFGQFYILTWNILIVVSNNNNVKQNAIAICTALVKCNESELSDVLIPEYFIIWGWMVYSLHTRQ